MTDWKAYGRDVRELRIARGWTQAEVGQRCEPKRSQSNIRDVEQGEYEGDGPNPRTIDGIQVAFGRRPGEDGYELTTKYFGKKRADTVADGEDPIVRVLSEMPEVSRDEVAKKIRELYELGQ